jgi:pimeloyl-ACP methyl ester carboxylesterase
LANEFPNIKGVLAIAPVTNLLKTEELGLGDNAINEWLPQGARNYPELDPSLSKVPSIPTVIIHGDSDVRVPIELSAAYVESKKMGANLNFVQLKDIGHFEIIDPTSSAFPEILSALVALRDV